MDDDTQTLVTDSTPPSSPGAEAAVTWTASEFIAHEKSALWYVWLFVAAGALAAALYLITRDKVTAMVVIGAAMFLAIYGARKPRQLDYAIDQTGVKVASKQFSFGDFKSFSVVHEGQFGAINFMPLRRFSPELTVYYTLEQEQQILSILANYLPFEEAKTDRIENLMRRIGF